VLRSARYSYFPWHGPSSDAVGQCRCPLCQVAAATHRLTFFDTLTAAQLTCSPTMAGGASSPLAPTPNTPHSSGAHQSPPSPPRLRARRSGYPGLRSGGVPPNASVQAVGSRATAVPPARKRLTCSASDELKSNVMAALAPSQQSSRAAALDYGLLATLCVPLTRDAFADVLQRCFHPDGATPVARTPMSGVLRAVHRT